MLPFKDALMRKAFSQICCVANEVTLLLAVGSDAKSGDLWSPCTSKLKLRLKRLDREFCE